MMNFSGIIENGKIGLFQKNVTRNVQFYSLIAVICMQEDEECYKMLLEKKRDFKG